MKTIEERARQHALAAVFGDENDSLYKDIETECVKLAKEQCKIDIEKALSFLRYHGEGDFSCWEEFEANFRKAMEG